MVRRVGPQLVGGARGITGRLIEPATRLRRLRRLHDSRKGFGDELAETSAAPQHQREQDNGAQADHRPQPPRDIGLQRGFVRLFRIVLGQVAMVWREPLHRVTRTDHPHGDTGLVVLENLTVGEPVLRRDDDLRTARSRRENRHAATAGCPSAGSIG